MKIISAVVLTSLVLLPVRWQPSMTATIDPKTEKVVDGSGNLRVPSDYRTAYQFLGSWAVAADQGPGAKQIHTVYASPGTITARAGVLRMLVKEVFAAGYRRDDYRHCQPRPNLKRLVRIDERQ